MRTTAKNNKDVIVDGSHPQRGGNRRVPCKARNVCDDHRRSKAFIEIPSGTQHGTILICSHPRCRGSGRKFRFCAVCDCPVAKRNFSRRHAHGLFQGPVTNLFLKKKSNNNDISAAGEGDNDDDDDDNDNNRKASLPQLGLRKRKTPLQKEEEHRSKKHLHSKSTTYSSSSESSSSSSSAGEDESFYPCSDEDDEENKSGEGESAVAEQKVKPIASISYKRKNHTTHLATKAKTKKRNSKTLSTETTTATATISNTAANTVSSSSEDTSSVRPSHYSTPGVSTREQEWLKLLETRPSTFDTTSMRAWIQSVLLLSKPEYKVVTPSDSRSSFPAFSIPSFGADGVVDIIRDTKEESRMLGSRKNDVISEEGCCCNDSRR